MASWTSPPSGNSRQYTLGSRILGRGQEEGEKGKGILNSKCRTRVLYLPLDPCVWWESYTDAALRQLHKCHRRSVRLRIHWSLSAASYSSDSPPAQLSKEATLRMHAHERKRYLETPFQLLWTLMRVLKPTALWQWHTFLHFTSWRSEHCKKDSILLIVFAHFSNI